MAQTDAMPDLMPDAMPDQVAFFAAPAGAGAFALTFAVPGLFPSATASLTQGTLALSGLACACALDPDGLSTDVTVTLTAGQYAALAAGPITVTITPPGGAPVSFPGFLELPPPHLLAADDSGAFLVQQGDTFYGVPFYLSPALLPGLTGATLLLAPEVSGQGFYPDPPAALRGKALAVDGLAQSPPFLRLDFPPGWGEADLPAGGWTAWALLAFGPDTAHPNGRAFTLPLFPDARLSLEGVPAKTALLRVSGPWDWGLGLPGENMGDAPFGPGLGNDPLRLGNEG